MEEHLYILTVFPFFFWLTYRIITQLTFLVGPDHQITQHTKLFGMKWEKHTLELSISVVFFNHFVSKTHQRQAKVSTDTCEKQHI